MGIPRKTFPKFADDDVWKVARALIEESEWLDENTGRSQNRQTCRHCGEWQPYNWGPGPSFPPIIHEPTCPVLVARDLLTGAPENVG